MAVTNYTDADASFGFFGYFDQLTDVTQRRWQGAACTWTGYVTGTDARMYGTTGAGGPPQTPFTVSIDGGAATTPATSAHPGWITLFSGLSDTPHLVQIWGTGAYYPSNSRTYVSGNLFEVTGAAPAIGSGTDLGDAYLITDPSFPGMHSHYLGALPAANVRPQYNFITNSSPSAYTRTGAILIKAACTDLWVFTGCSEFFLSIDGALPTRITHADADSTSAKWRKIATGLDASVAHEYMIVCSFHTTSNITPPSGVMAGGSGASFSSLPTRSRLLQVGDSITESTNASTVRSGNMDLWKVAPQIGVMPHAAGKAGITTATFNTAWASILAAMNVVPEYAVIALGRNDASGAAFRTAYTDCINNLLAAGVTRIACRRITPDNPGTYSATLDADIQTVVAAVGNPAVTYIGDSSWTGVSTIEGNSGTDGANPTFNGTHPDRAGYVTQAAFLLDSYRAKFAASGRRNNRAACVIGAII